jgi:hypothetical protein
VLIEADILALNDEIDVPGSEGYIVLKNSVFNYGIIKMLSYRAQTPEITRIQILSPA